MAYEWEFKNTHKLSDSGLVDQSLSKQLKNAFVKYQASLRA